MWLSNSSVGRKLIMAVTGACLLAFVTFHCLMNAVAICWPAAYNSICEFLGANWYALIGSAAIAVLVLLHIVYAVWLTMQNRKARGNVRYAMSQRPASVEWSSKNMFVLGIVIVAFFVVHLIQFWSKMQLQEICGGDVTVPPAAGTIFIHQAFSQPWTIIVYAIGFIALWFHLNHGFWSMFQSAGWNNKVWIPRLKKIGCCWVTIVMFLFLAEGIVFTIKANDNYYLTNETLREQYKDMTIPMIEESFGPEATQFATQVKMLPYEQVSMGLHQMYTQLSQQLEQAKTPEGQQYFNTPEAKEELKKMEKQEKCLGNIIKFFDYLEESDNKPGTQMPASAGQNPY